MHVSSMKSIVKPLALLFNVVATSTQLQAGKLICCSAQDIHVMNIKRKAPRERYHRHLIPSCPLALAVSRKLPIFRELRVFTLVV